MSNVRASVLWSLLFITVSGCSLVSDFGGFKFKKSDKTDAGQNASDAGADAGKGKLDAGLDAGKGKHDSGIKDASIMDADLEDSGTVHDSGTDAGNTPTSHCGDHAIDGDEECDDGNGIKGD